MSNVTEAFNSTRGDLCEVERNWYTLGFQAIVLPSIFINATTLIGAAIDRKKLQRENCFFASVISTIVSNNVYLFMLEWILFDNYWDPKSLQRDYTVTFEKMLWVFLESFTIAIPFLIGGNIVCLTYVTVNSASYVGRVARVEDKETAARRSKRVRWVTSALLVTSWLVPAVLTILAMTVMNCVDKCFCPTTNYQGDLCPGTHHYCSWFWAPVTISYLWTNVGLWSFAIATLCALVWRSIDKFQQTTRRASVNLNAAPDLNRNNLPLSARDDSNSYVLSIDNDSTSNSNNNSTNENALKPPVKRPLTRQDTKLSFKDRLNPRLYFALILSAIYIACSACFVAAIIIDSLVSSEAVSVYGNVIFALARITMWLYTTVCPIVMVRHLPQLKISLDRLYHKVTHCAIIHSPKRHSIQ